MWQTPDGDPTLNAPPLKFALSQAYAKIECSSCTETNVTCRMCTVVAANRHPGADSGIVSDPPSAAG